MNALLNILSAILSKIFAGGIVKKDSNSSEKTNKIEFSTPNNVMNDARASVIWLCVAILAIIWIPRYVYADIVWIMDCIKHDALLPFPISDKQIIDLLGSLLGLGVVGAIHKIINK